MKLKILFTLALLITVLAGCSANADNDGHSNDQTLAYSTYMAGAFLSDGTEDTTTTSTDSTAALNTTDAEGVFAIEEHLGEVSEHFNRLQVFLDNGMDDPFTIDQNPDVEGDYDITMQYTVEDKVFTILLNEDEDGTLDGTLILDDVEYDVEGRRDVETDSDDDGNTVATEQEIYLRTADRNNTDRWVEMAIETEDAGNEYAFEMEMTTHKNGVEKEVRIEFYVENEEVAIEIDTGDGNAYEFSKEDEDQGNMAVYAFEYTVDGIYGEVVLIITTNDDGEEVYRYTIEEDGEEKEIESIQDDDDNDTT